MQQPSFKEATRFWLKLGFISFGGPAGQIAIMHEFVVTKKKWISDKKFLHAMNYCMLLPGPEAQQLATYIGWLLHGVKGGIIAGLLFILPSVFILLGLSILYVEYGNIEWISAMLSGLKPAIVAIVIVALIKISRKSLKQNAHYILACISFISIYFFDIPFPLIVLMAICVGIIFIFLRPKNENGHSKNNDQISSDEDGYYLTTQSNVSGSGFQLERLIKQIFIFSILWFIPFFVCVTFASNPEFWKNLILFFTQSAFVTFGGAYAVLPYVAQQAVENFHWLNTFQMIDGLALGESTPGPLIMVLAFVGFMAGFNAFSGSILLGSIGLIATTYFTFLPSFMFIFVGAPIIEKTQQNKSIKIILQFVTAAIVGVVLKLTFYLAEIVLLNKHLTKFSEFSIGEINLLHLIWIVLSFIALYRFKVNMILWICISALFGIVVYFLS